jgi:hypothetical protein
MASTEAPVPSASACAAPKSRMLGCGCSIAGPMPEVDRGPEVTVRAAMRMGASHPSRVTSIVICRYVYWREGKREEGGILVSNSREMLTPPAVGA